MKNITLSNNLVAIVTLASVAISGVSVPTTQFDQAKPYVDAARTPKTGQSMQVGSYTASLTTPEPVIKAGNYTFTLADFDAVYTALTELRAEAARPKSRTVQILPNINAVVTATGITVNGQTLPADVLINLNAAVAEVNS